MGHSIPLAIFTVTLPIHMLNIILPYHFRFSKRLPTKILFPFLISLNLTTFQLILDLTIIAVLYVDPGGRRIMCESAAARLFALRVRIPLGALVSICYFCVLPVEVPASGWSLLLKSPTECVCGQVLQQPSTPTMCRMKIIIIIIIIIMSD